MSDLVFPTKKPHISYSEVKNWKECPFRHKLSYIDKHSIFEASVYTEFGTAVHYGCENYLINKTIDLKGVRQIIEDAWDTHGFASPEYIEKFTSKAKASGWNYVHFPMGEWISWAEIILKDLEGFLNENFNEWELVSAEEELYEAIQGREVKFKGFIDCILKVKDKKGKRQYWIIDWKTASPRGWSRDKTRDFLTHAQIMAYKYFWSKRENIDIKDVRCAFVLLKRQSKPGKSIYFLPISAGKKSLEKTEKLINNMINAVKNKMFIKNRNSCKFCEFYNTEHCK